MIEQATPAVYHYQKHTLAYTQLFLIVNAEYVSLFKEKGCGTYGVPPVVLKGLISIH